MFGAGFVEAGGVELDGAFPFEDGFDDGIVEAAEVAVGGVGEFLDEVGVAEKIEEAGAGHAGVFFPVGGPDLVDVGFSPPSEPLGVVEVPFVAEVVDGADEVIPVVGLVEVVDPVEAVGEPIAFESGADGEASGGVDAGAVDPVEVGREIGLQHAPVVKGFGALWGVVGDPVFGEIGSDGLVDKGPGFAFGMETKRGVGVVICGHVCFGVYGRGESY